MQTLKGRRFLVTGGSKGIGRSIARDLVDRGAQVAICARHVDRLGEVAREIGAVPLVADLSREEDAVSVVGKAVEQLGGLDGHDNNAGIGAFMEVAHLDTEAFRRVLAVNVLAPAILVRESVPHLRAAGGGDIVNISSTSGVKGDARGTIYTSSKFALRGMSQCWQAELRPHDIRVIHVNPSYVETGFGEPDEPAEKRPQFLQADDIAQAVIGCLGMERRGFVPEITIYATNPWS
jgi:3-oxoacyl-[acyl-carrier protein] reductase